MYPYLLREMDVCQPNQVWAMDITYIPMARGFWFISRRYSIGTHGECCVAGIDIDGHGVLHRSS